jgi:hypothetical protein
VTTYLKKNRDQTSDMFWVIGLKIASFGRGRIKMMVAVFIIWSQVASVGGAKTSVPSLTFAPCLFLFLKVQRY